MPLQDMVDANTAATDPQRPTLDSIRAKYAPPVQAPSIQPPTQPQQPPQITDQGLLSESRGNIESYMTIKHQLEAKYGGDIVGRAMDDEKKALDDAKQNAESASRQLSALNLNLKEVPRPPELQDVQKDLAGLAPSIATILTLVGAATGRFGKGQGGIGFAQTYNAMVDTFKKNAYEEFQEKSKAFQQQLETWKADTQRELAEYTNAINKWQKGQDISKEMAELNLKSAEMPMSHLLTLNDLIGKATTSYEQIATKMSNERSKDMMEGHYKEQERHDRAMEGIAASKERKSENQNNYTLDPGSSSELTKAIAEGRLDPARLNSRTAKMLGQMFKENPNLDMNNASATAGALKKLETQRSQTESFANTANKNFDLVEKMYDKYGPTRTIFVLNKLRADFDYKFTGDPDAVMLGRTIKTALMEYAKVVSGQTGGAAVSDSARQEVETLLTMADNPQAFHGSIGNHRLEIKNREAGFQETIDALKKGRGGNVRTDKPSTDRVKVMSPTGTTGTIPSDQLDEAIKNGYKQVK